MDFNIFYYYCSTFFTIVKKNYKSICYNKIMNIAAIIISVILAFMGFAGGGGSSSGGGGGGGFSGGSSYSSHSSSSSSSSSSDDSDPLLFFVTFGIIAVIIFILNFKGGKSYKDHNSTTLEKQLHTPAKQIFESYQSDWTNFNYAGISKYTTSHYQAHASLMLDLLRELHRVNKVSKLKVRKVILLDSIPENTTLPIHIRFKFIFDGQDEVIDETTNQKLYSTYVSYADETWNFIYDGQSLKLEGISQPTESAPHLIKSLANFADENQLFYSPDWGRYALPARGLIFGGSSMKIADVNNHIIGKWGDSLIQLYTYAPTPGQTTSSYYIVGQINVPKKYLGVIVKSRKFNTSKKPDKSYEKFKMEWNEFNDRYEVYAASRDALPAFELLNPKFMEYLYSKNPSYSLEVVDNTIYIYTNIRNVTEDDYKELLEVLQKAYAELKN